MEILLKVLTFVFGAVCMFAAAGIFARLIEKILPCAYALDFAGGGKMTKQERQRKNYLTRFIC